MKTINLLSLAFLLVASTSFAQKAETPDNQYDVGGKIESTMMLDDSGVLLVMHGKGIAGIKAGESAPTFNYTEYGSVKAEEVSVIPNSPYVMVSQGGFMSSKKALIDVISGRTIFSTEGNGWKQIYSANVYMPQNKLVVSGLQKSKAKFEGGTTKLAVYDISSGKEDFGFFMTKPGKVTVGAGATVCGTPLLTSKGLIIPTTKGMLAKDKSGNDLWENKVKNVNWMVASEDEKDIYAFELTNNGGNTKIYKINSNGQEAWDGGQKVQGTISTFEILPQGLAVVSDKVNTQKGIAKLAGGKSQSNIAMLSASTGEDLWSKAPKTKGYVQHFYVMDDGIVFGIQEGGINKISFDGQTLFKKPLKTGENIHTMAQTDNGMIYITDSDANIINLSNGEQVWDKPLKYKNSVAVASAYDDSNKKFYISTKDGLYEIDEATGNYDLKGEIEFDGKEMPTSMNVRDGELVMTSDQNVMKMTTGGNVTWHTYQASPGKSLVGKLIAGVTAVASMAMASAAAYQAGANKTTMSTYNSYGADMKRKQDMFSDIADVSFKEMAKRFKATAATQDQHFMLTKLDGGAGLLVVNKDSGDIDKQILLKDKKPEYEIDERGGVLYYQADNNTIYAYNL